MQKTSDLRISGRQEVISASTLLSDQPISEKSSETVFNARQSFSDIIYKKDKRLAVVVGPCSIHDTEAAMEYANLLMLEKDDLADHLLIIMRVYFEKPRTTVGWKGLINDPDLDNSFNIDKGLSISRQLLRDINDLGMPAGTEFLDVITPQYLADLISWGAIGARTTESQVHRELASGSSCPIGFKNATNGGIQVAADAIGSALHPHKFLSVTKDGRAAIFSSSGNKDCHVILRGGTVPNYQKEFIEETSEILNKNNLEESIMVDMSHGNSSKQHKKQIEVCQNIAEQIILGEERITGVMIESNLQEGNQKADDLSQLVYGQSITDACIDWQDTKNCLHELAEAVSRRNN
ncbi:3-deoxy-7-phosphoheptulonate synthase [Gammaproteobacteria bacterium]|nr:3-deoxy-7-phosphoheptulonate synthase [Gammaproteobacteria bacterium]MDB3995269.1 3-deoxy-7-phosphoheptulonate synthase [Gammaproteobacteria bacterium]MDC0508977.1 3-deoxy-7-phosphoheptulonate synthase [Gammaproteobacteria bacterium]